MVGFEPKVESLSNYGILKYVILKRFPVMPVWTENFDDKSKAEERNLK